MKFILLFFFTIVLQSCAGFSSPNKNLIKQKPVIRAGNTSVTNHSDYVLMIPAGLSYPINTMLNSSLFKQKGKVNSQIQLNHDLYIYKQWASYDGKRWYRLQDFFDVELTSEMNVKGGTININLEPIKKIKP